MPLSTPTSRKLAHTRVVTCHSYHREDDLWDIEGRIVDTKPYRFENHDRGGWIEADEALHDISIRLTINMELEVIDADAVIDASPYNYCKSVKGVARNLIGLKIAAGWTKKSRIAMGSHLGCTHLTELLGPVATTAIQTIISENIRRAKGTSGKRQNDLLNSCYSYAEDSPVVRSHLKDFYRGNG